MFGLEGLVKSVKVGKSEMLRTRLAKNGIKGLLLWETGVVQTRDGKGDHPLEALNGLLGCERISPLSQNKREQERTFSGSPQKERTRKAPAIGNALRMKLQITNHIRLDRIGHAARRDPNMFFVRTSR